MVACQCQESGMPPLGGGMPMPGSSMPPPSGGMPMPIGGMPIPSGMPVGGGGMPPPSTGMPMAGGSMPPPSIGMPVAGSGMPTTKQWYATVRRTLSTTTTRRWISSSCRFCWLSSCSIDRPPVTHGTVKPATNFSAENDAAALRNAMKGLGTDEKAIIVVLTRRSNEQKQQIKLKFKSMYGKDLIKELKSELSGNFREVILGLMMNPAEFDSYNLHKGIEGIGTDEDALIEILCSRSNEEIQKIKKQYKEDHKVELEKDIRGDTSGHFRRLLISMTTAAREPDGPIDRQKARQDAQVLYQAGEAKWGTDEAKFNSILCARSYAHLRVVFDEYSKISRYDIEQSISREMSGDLKNAMITIVKCVRDKSGYFAERLYKSMKGLGTDDKTLIRVMVSRCEVDMVEIKSAFEKMHRKSLESFIKGDTSGDYKRALLALAGEY
ncbi:LOW QUALITY PROTEIN: annexin A4-like [Gigantopelta aegis]|uniref:LOW QUALITY PROTEIN: annexin A4-like n=1 Tax=Gigantopelta aegis TaxID=1735272 RepID=UPI001B88C702|nr:LOW QUALITY PROTEIN: annexin A4-like [Gigantopelta aegis]